MFMLKHQSTTGAGLGIEPVVIIKVSLPSTKKPNHKAATQLVFNTYLIEHEDPIESEAVLAAFNHLLEGGTI